MKQHLLTVLFVSATMALYAQAPSAPDLQAADYEIFDPTRPKVKEKEAYRFAIDYRLEVGYVQNYQRTDNLSFADMYLHGARVGMNFDFLLPIHFTIQTGVWMDLTYGTNEQHWRSLDMASVQAEYIQHRVLEWDVVVPVRCYYTIPVWKKLNLFFFTGPEFSIGLIEHDFLLPHLSEGAKEWVAAQGYAVEEYDRFTSNELYRCNVRWSLGGGIEWDRYRLQSGYNFGLNNLVKTPVISDQKMNEWGWFVSFCYKL